MADYDYDLDERGLLKVNEHFQTNLPNIYAVGDVIGFPSLASTSMEQGRLASCHAFGVKTNHAPELFPYGIYTIPEISTVGKELTQAGIHIGQAVMAFKGKIDYFINTMFNYPRLADCYKTAAFDGVNRLGN